MEKTELYEEAKRLLAITKSLGADHSQIMISGLYNIGTRFGENHITQNVGRRRLNIQLKTQIGQKIGTYSGSKLGDAAAEELKSTLTLTKLSADDTEFPGFLDIQPIYPEMKSSYSEVDPEELAELIAEIVETARSVDSRLETVAGNLNFLSNRTYLINSHGVEAYNENTTISGVINVAAREGNESRSTINYGSGSISTLPVEEKARSVAETAVRGLHPKHIEPGRYETIMMPGAVTALLNFLAFGSSSQGLINHSSFLKDKLGEEIMDKRLTIRDDTQNPDHLASRRFDSDGVPSPEIDYVEKGILKDYAYNMRNAKKLGVESNGRNFSGFQGETPLFFSPHVRPGGKDFDTMISEIDDGVLITNLFYNNFVNAPEGLCTGLTRDGLFKIERGEIVHSLKNMRWTDKILSIFANAEPARETTQIKGFFFGSAITPAIRTASYNFSSKGKH